MNCQISQQGDNTAFKAIYDKLSLPLTYYVKNIVRSRIDAQDITANAFAKLLHAREKLTSPEHIRKWLYVTARNEAIDLLNMRTRQRHFSKEIRCLYLSSDEIEDVKDLEMLKMSLLQTMAYEIEKLPRQRKKILRLYFFEKKNTSEIAKQLKLNCQTVLNHKTRALVALRNRVPTLAELKGE